LTTLCIEWEEEKGKKRREIISGYFPTQKNMIAFSDKV